VALGRKNWIHIGSPQAGPKVAAILWIMESCRRLKLPMRDYLTTVLPGFADLPIQRLLDLTFAGGCPAFIDSIDRIISMKSRITSTHNCGLRFNRLDEYEYVLEH